MAATMTKNERSIRRKIGDEPIVVLTSDTLIGLVRDMEAMKKRISDLEGQVQDNFDSLVEHIPKVIDEGIEIKAFAKGDADGYEAVVVEVKEHYPLQ